MGVGELLAQATCAVRASKDGRTIGTAWLATDEGHLLTAGHVVAPLAEQGEVWVRFPDAETDERATFVIQPVHDKPAAQDFAVLRLDRPNDRRPLPFTLVTQADGRVRARGYGDNLRSAQSGGTGVLTPAGNYLRTSSSWAYYFQYETTTLAVTGFSGAAVYSDLAGAVIGIQVEAEGGRQAFAMPLARIVDYWEELVGAAVRPTRGRCVLLQPSTTTEAQRDIVRERILRPVLEQLNLALYVSEPSGMRGEDLKQLELADVVIADITDADPAVVYELTVAQGLGTPDVVIRDRSADSPAVRIFDVLDLDLDDVESSRRTVEQRLLSVRSIFEALGENPTTNPMTSFFKAPLTQISVANALAAGYARNFVLPVANALLEISTGRGPGSVTVDGVELSAERLRDVTVTVVVPKRLEWCSDDFIDLELAQTSLVVPATVTHPDFSRPRPLKCLPLVDGEPVRLLDVFPTTLSTVAESIDERFDVDPHRRTSDHWMALEQKEIDRFQSKLVKRIRSAGDRRVGPRFLRDVVRISTAAAVFPDLSG